MRQLGKIMDKPMEPGSEQWLRCMSASKIAAVVGLSPWESRFSLWHSMAGTVEKDPMNSVQSRGHYLEPAIANWFADQHKGQFEVIKTLPWYMAKRPDFTADTDRILLDPKTKKVIAGLEIKSSGEEEGWGPDGSDIIPVYYEAQIQWQMHVCGYDITHVAALLPRLQFREYTIRYNKSVAWRLADAADTFMDTLPWGKNPQRPDIDAHTETYQVLKKIHPEIDPDAEVELDPVLAENVWAAKEQYEAAKESLTYHQSLLSDRMRDARWAVIKDEDGESQKIALRKMSGGKTPRPYVQVWPRKKKTLEGAVA